MKIHVGNLSEGVHEFRFEPDGEEIGVGPAITGPIVVDARLEKTSTQLFLTATVAATWTLNCDRCLAEFERDLAHGYRMTYLFDAGETQHFDPAEVQVISPSMLVIDITEDVRQTLQLAVPLKLLCGEDCRGLCPTCGANLNTGSCDCREASSDSRWDALNDLRAKD